MDHEPCIGFFLGTNCHIR